MAVPYTFASATGSIPLSYLDTNFSTPITIGNTAVTLGSTITTAYNMTLGNVIITSVGSQFPNNYLANANVILGTTTVSLGNTATTLDGLTLANVTVSTGNVTLTKITVTTANVTTANISTAVITTANVTTANLTTAAITTANVTTANVTTAVITTGNIATANITNIVYSGTLTGGTGVVAIGTNQFYKDASGSVGIGTTSPTQKLDTRGNALFYNAGSAVYVALDTATTTYDGGTIAQYGVSKTQTAGLVSTFGYNGLSFGTSGLEKMRIDSSGNVGIGTTSPATLLNVYNATSAAIQVDGDAAAAIRVTRYSTNATGPTSVVRKARGTLASPTAVATSDESGGLYMQAYGGTNFRNIARIDGLVQTYTSDTNIAGALRFYTNNSSTDVTEVMRIDSAGNSYIETGLLWQYAPTPTTKSAAATLTAAELATDIITLTGTTYTITLPTGTALDTYYTGVPSVNIGYDFHIVNTASGIITIAVGASGMTSVGLLTVAATGSAHFRLRRTAANTYILYRLS